MTCLSVLQSPSPRDPRLLLAIASVLIFIVCFALKG
jgi:hypothetical protein